MGLPIDYKKYFIIGFLIFLFLIFIVLAFYGYLEKKYKKDVISNSNRYKRAKEIADQFDYVFSLQKLYRFYFPLQTKSKFDNISRQQIATKIISSKSDLILVVEQGLSNLKESEKYLELMKTIPKVDKTRNNFYQRIEENVTSDLIISSMPTVPLFVGEISYTSPKGKKHYERTEEYTVREMQDYITEIERLEKAKESAKYQRSLMTPSLRYKILKRDGFRCTICGRTADDGVTLQVDHIIPVSKGGRTIPMNLRTLCDECNLGKSDQYDEEGLN